MKKTTSAKAQVAKQSGDVLASEIMKTKVAHLSPSDSIEAAVALFEELRIGGAPVVDGAGRPLGVLTASDIAQSSHVRSGRIETDHSDFVLAEPYGDEEDSEDVEELEAEMLEKEGYSPGVEGGDTVGDWMSTEVITVAPDASLKTVCRAMIAHRIHRVFVVERKKLKGVITSYDVVRWVAEHA